MPMLPDMEGKCLSLKTPHTSDTGSRGPSWIWPQSLFPEDYTSWYQKALCKPPQEGSRSWRFSSVVEHLLTKCKAMSLILSFGKKRQSNKKDKRREAINSPTQVWHLRTTTTASLEWKPEVCSDGILTLNAAPSTGFIRQPYSSANTRTHTYMYFHMYKNKNKFFKYFFQKMT